MRGRWMRRAAAAGLAWTCAGLAAPAVAQVGSPNGANPPSVGAMMANPYLNPYLNPYMNPAAAQRPMSGRDAAMYLYMANQANGGLGAGQISGVRPAPGAMRPGQVPAGQPAGRAQPRAGAATAKGRGRMPVAEMPDSAAVPGAGAARFFNPGPARTNGAGRYFARPNGYFNNNGH